MLVIFCSVAIGVDFAFVLLGSIWRIVIVLIGCIKESSVIVCWPKVCMFVIFVKWDGHVYFWLRSVGQGHFGFIVVVGVWWWYFLGVLLLM